MSKHQTTSVPTNTLKVGDVIICHGGLFRVFEVKAYDDCHANYCEFLGNAFEGYECQIPKHWRDGQPASAGRPKYDNFWNEQGNGLASSTLVTNFAG
jgi:hypothetical protein